MSDLPNKLIEAAKQVVLSAEEKRVIRMRLSNMIANTPPVATPASSSPFSLANLMNYTAFMRFAPFALVVLLIGGGAVAAEGALPGDLLYSFKTGVNENVRSAITVGPEANAKWQAELASRRLTEANVLKSEGKLDAETETKLATQVQEHYALSVDAIATLATAGDEEAVANTTETLKNAISVNTEASNTFAAKSVSVDKSIDTVVSSLQADLQGVISSSTDAAAENNLESNLSTEVKKENTNLEQNINEIDLDAVETGSL